MAYKQPTRRKNQRDRETLNLIPILDSVFIFLFFLLMSSQFLKIYEIGSDIPILSAANPPPSKEKPLGLTVEVTTKGFEVSTSRGNINFIVPKAGGEYDLETLHSKLVGIKKANIYENQVIFEPQVDVEYQQIINMMDAMRTMRNSDDLLTRKNKKTGIDEVVKELFNKIVFGNLMS
ncbi:MAG: hypothetical protein CME65_07050 [Halobacteriovoraceae bacterium]|nr:hypothetical protein [Halobacteriovoraceae bacterium]|tara:strand:+ start:3024 stop:3554 length:531 start_codon:yes stop_codon:yes gene_type:complete